MVLVGGGVIGRGMDLTLRTKYPVIKSIAAAPTVLICLGPTSCCPKRHWSLCRIDERKNRV
jgi:hypothetical protein